MHPCQPSCHLIERAIPRVPAWRVVLWAVGSSCLFAACDGDTTKAGSDTWSCVIPEGKVSDDTQQLGCESDFSELGARPLDSSIPGARSLKTIIDRADEMALYFINTNAFPRHYDFAQEHLSGGDLPAVGDIALFNSTEYYSPNRRFILGAVTWYDHPGAWTYEIAPYDTASAEMVADAYALIRDNSFFGEDLRFHPTSSSLESIVPDLPDWVKVITTDELFAGIDYQPLNLGESLGRLRFVHAAGLDSAYVGPCDVVVLDAVPNDISAVAGIITSETQTPLSHLTVLSQNRGTPNMALRGAFDSPELLDLEDAKVRLVVDAFEYRIEFVSESEADAWCEAHMPPAIEVPAPDLSVTDLRDIELVTVHDISVFGGKASHYGEMTKIGEEVPQVRAFAIPVYYYEQFEHENGFDTQIAALLQDEGFLQDPAQRDVALRNLRQAISIAPVNQDFEASLMAKLEADYPGVRMRFRSSTNAEDLNGFTGAGLYDSYTGDPNDPSKPVLDAVRAVWASLWNFRAFEERSFRRIHQLDVAMGILVHNSFPDEEANGVALTANMFDEAQPAFYINAQAGGASVVKPDPGVTVDSFLYYFDYPRQPIAFFAHSSLVPSGESVLSPTQISQLGRALAAIHDYFAQYYDTGAGFYAMDVEFKFDDLGSGMAPQLWIKQARPHYGWDEGK